MKKYCVVTCIFNNYEPVRDPVVVDSDADYFLFTDSDSLKSDVWKIVYMPDMDTRDLTGVQKTYILKYTFHKYIDTSRYDYMIQLDSSIQIYKSLEPIIGYMRRNRYDISVAPHFWRDDFMKEYSCWVRGRALNPKYVEIFKNSVKDYDYDHIKGLFECSMKIYRCSDEVFSFIDDVHEVMTETNNNEDKNDQCYFTYILYKYLDRLKVNYHSASLYRHSDYMKMFDHGSTRPSHPKELVYKSYNIKFLNRDIEINRLDAYN